MIPFPISHTCTYPLNSRHCHSDWTIAKEASLSGYVFEISSLALPSMCPLPFRDPRYIFLLLSGVKTCQLPADTLISETLVNSGHNSTFFSLFLE